uniref:Uncharacterized protein n=1 Tax=viral metagenome TaxID=1070528 RepID=A0A6M3L7G8_9ZZZZ
MAKRNRYFIKIKFKSGREFTDSFDDARTRAYYIISISQFTESIETWESEDETTEVLLPLQETTFHG